jgi:hypothetical protein
MSEKISLPTVNLRMVAQEILTETDNLVSETESRHQGIVSTKSELPTSLQSIFDNFLEPFHTNLQQVLAFRRFIGETLSSTADTTESAEGSISTDFQTP